MDLDKLKTTAGLDVHGKRVLVRADLNVPVREGQVTDATRLERLAPGLLDLTNRGARVVVISHFGRPKGGPDPEFSLKPVAAKLGELLSRPVTFVGDCVGPQAERAVEALAPGQIAVLENLRFHAEEEANDPVFAKSLAMQADCFVQDAFGAVHRAHASTAGVAKLLPSAAGLLLSKEIYYLSKALESPERPFMAILGGAKVSDKIEVIDAIVSLPVQDAFGWRDRINEPATVTARNWTFRLPWLSDQLARAEEAQERQAHLRRLAERWNR